MGTCIKLLKSLPLQLVLSISIAFILGSFLDAGVVSLFYTVSSCFIDLLLFLLPLMVFGFLFAATSETQQNSVRRLLLIFAGVFVSNFLALYTSYFFSQLILPFAGVDSSPDIFAFQSSVDSLFRLKLPLMPGTDLAMGAAVILGLLLKKDSGNKAKAFISQGIAILNQCISWILHRLVIPLLPIYVFGFCLKLSYDQALPLLFKSYGKVFIFGLFLLVAYLFALYLLAAKGDIRVACSYIKKMLPAGLTGFSTMSSAATLPVTLKCTEENTQDRGLTHLILPTTSNIHMLGDDLTIVIASMTMLGIFGLPMPNFATFSLFAAAFCIAKLSCVGIPGASVLVVLPVVQNYLNFSPEMIAVLTTIYILQDPIGTTANVMGNGALALVLQRVINAFKPKPLEAAEISKGT